MPRRSQGFVEDAFDLAKISPIASLCLTSVAGVAYAIFKWIWLPTEPYNLFCTWISGILFAIFAAATIYGFIGHAARQRTLNRQRSLEDLRSLTWGQFEHLVADAYQRKGYRKFDNGGPGDGGVDVILRREDARIAVQCKQWKTWSIGEPALRDFLGAITDGGYDQGIFVTVGKFTAAAQKFADRNRIELVDGEKLLALVKDVQPGSVASSVPVNIEPSPSRDQTPSCPKCHTPMVRRVAKRGPQAGSQFWGCPSYPACRGTLPLAP